MEALMIMTENCIRFPFVYSYFVMNEMMVTLFCELM